jgi:hypothetical protein
MAKVCTLDDYIFNRSKKKEKPADASPGFFFLFFLAHNELPFNIVPLIHGHLFVTDILNNEFNGKSGKYQMLFI